MFDNFVEESYHSWDHVYKHPQTGYHIFIGDAQSALNHAFLEEKSIKTGI
jgi:hypothetical protein